jgi:uncharacterized protein YdhG (YjbR/CyaY superfamily)
MDDEVKEYIDAIPAGDRPLFDRVDRLVLATFPTATLTLSYRMPTYRVGRNRLFVGVWKHGLSIYGWAQDAVDDYVVDHPHLRKTSKGTIQIGVEDDALITDDELRYLVRAALDR